MKGIILAGGRGSRLRPLTNIINKNLLPVYDRPMILHAIDTLTRSGITDIMVVCGEDRSEDFINFLGSGGQYGVTLSYAIQKEFLGSGDAIAQAESFGRGEKVAVIFGDNFFEDDFREDVKKFEAVGGAMIFLKEVPDPHRFGIAEVVGDKIKSIEEKPAEPKSNLASVGFYLYDETLFDKIKTLEPSIRGELEITDVQNQYLANEQLYWSRVPGFWSDMGTFDSLHQTATWLANHVHAEKKEEAE